MRRRTVPSGSGPSTIRARFAGSVRARPKGHAPMPSPNKRAVGLHRTTRPIPPVGCQHENEIHWRRPVLLQRETMNAAPEPPLFLWSASRSIPVSARSRERVVQCPPEEAS